jgi:hypothetical protein
MTWWAKFGLGGLGGLLPLLVSLQALDNAAFAVLSNGTGISTGIAVGYAIRGMLSFGIGGIMAALNWEVQNPFSLLQIGIAAPAIITSLVTPASLNKPANPPVSSQHTSLFISDAFAADTAATPRMQLAEGFLSDVVKGLQPGLGVDQQMNNHANDTPLAYDVTKPGRIIDPQTSVCVSIPANSVPSLDNLAQSFPAQQFRIENDVCP